MAKPYFNTKIYHNQAEIAKALANPTRLAILHFLRDGEKNVSEIVHAIRGSQSDVSQNLMLLRERQIVKTRQEGRSFYYRLASPKIGQALDLIRELSMEHLSQKKASALGEQGE